MLYRSLRFFLCGTRTNEMKVTGRRTEAEHAEVMSHLPLLPSLSWSSPVLVVRSPSCDSFSDSCEETETDEQLSSINGMEAISHRQLFLEPLVLFH